MTGYGLGEYIRNRRLYKAAFDLQKKDEKIIVSDFETKGGGINYTYLTVGHFYNEYSPCELYFLVGTDMLADFCTWMYPERTLACATLCVVEREGDDLAAAERIYYSHFDKPVTKLAYKGKNVSSTRIRAAAALRLPLDLASPAVKEEIEKTSPYCDKYSEFVVKNLPIKRLKHTFGVMVLAVTYAKRLKINATDAYIAAMLHDAAKYIKASDVGCPLPENVPPQVEHQFVGAFIAENVLKIENKDIINAIRYHTTGRPEMSELEKVVFVADLLEEGRDYDEVGELRRAVDEDFEKGFVKCIGRLMKHLEESGGELYYLTEKCRDYYCKE